MGTDANVPAEAADEANIRGVLAALQERPARTRETAVGYIASARSFELLAESIERTVRGS